MKSSLHTGPAGWWAPLCAVALAAIPPLAAAFGQEYYVGLAARILVFGIAATSLNLIVGYGGMVSFGHAAFFGSGAYAVAVLASYGIASPWVAWPAAMAVAAAFAAAIGAASLRTRGLYFIMITLAFAQMVFYLAVSLKALGGDDGLSLAARPVTETALYYIALALAAATLYLLRRVIDSPFGRALQGIRENESRMEAIGFPVLRLKLAAFVIAGAVAGLAGALVALLNGRAGPGLLDWPQSGSLLVMVILGGVGHRLGGFIGAAVLLALEEFLSPYWSHWQLVLGVLLLAVVLRAPRGLAGLFARG
ncbi:MAG TPA: branched-chain amino acid ABC transporter permease [Usitatibacter sp.]|nr:branched-chain amino acid ABC transporter permease [Usitatibacter sp.]